MGILAEVLISSFGGDCSLDHIRLCLLRARQEFQISFLPSKFQHTGYREIRTPSEKQYPLY
jgi:hypothetical protein